jgi:triphosphatase
MDRVEGSPTGSYDGAPARSRLRLAARDGEAVPQPAPPVTLGKKALLTADISLDDALAAILGDCLDRYATHATALRKRYDAEAVHQLRVALRRLRAFLGLVKDVAPCAERVSLMDGARKIAGAVGWARDLDVFCEALRGDAKEIFADEPSFYALLDAAELRRFRAQEAAQAAVAAPASLQFEADLRSFVLQRAWRAGTQASREPGSAKDFAAKQLRRFRRRAQKRCRNLAQASAEELHEARIAVKKARYAAELFAGMFGADEARAYVRGLAKIQDRLGQINDQATAKRLLGEIVKDNPALADAPAVVLLRGRHDGASRRSAATAKHCARRLRRLQPFWPRSIAKASRTPT